MRFLLIFPLTFLFACNVYELAGSDPEFSKEFLNNVQNPFNPPVNAFLEISPGGTFHFGPVAVGGDRGHFFTVSNIGQDNATTVSESGITAPFVFVGGSYPGTGGDCGATINSFSSCTINIKFAPTGTGNFTDIIQLDYNDGASAQSAFRNIDGIGANPALLSISETDPFDYGTTAGPATHTFTITNSGDVDATALSGSMATGTVYGFLGGGYPGTGGTCGTSLAGFGATCTIVVEFDAASPTVYNDTIQISYNDGAAAQSVTRDVTGTHP